MSQLCLEIISNSSSNIQTNQRILFEFRGENEKEDGSLSINVIKMEMNKIDEDGQHNNLEIFVEVDEEIGEEKILFISRYAYFCYLYEFINQYSVRSAIKGENGKKQIKLIEIVALLYAHVDLEINRKEQVVESINWIQDEKEINGISSMFYERNECPNKLNKLICFLNPKGPREIIKRKKYIRKESRKKLKNIFIDSMATENQRQKRNKNFHIWKFV
uniref:BTB domain-containing protein n=1 Tax=Meloidogyne hapla TaxID=6305 RepID=A0A1I8B675_MELHA